MRIELDHLVVAAAGLEEGAAWVAARVGAAPVAGGSHATMGTHNRLLSLGSESYLEVIAIDPAAPSPGRARWFALDDPRTAARLARGPALLHWVVRTDDIAAALAAMGSKAEVLAMSRGDYRWRIGVPRDGHLALDGVAPTVIEWEGARPAERLPESGVRLERLTLRHREAARVLAALHAAGLDAAGPVEASGEGTGLAARFSTPGGPATLGE